MPSESVDSPTWPEAKSTAVPMDEGTGEPTSVVSIEPMDEGQFVSGMVKGPKVGEEGGSSFAVGSSIFFWAEQDETKKSTG